MKYVYPALLHPNANGSTTIRFPDLPGTNSEGKDPVNTMEMAEASLEEWIEYLTDKKTEIPKPSAIQDIEVGDGWYAALISADVRDNKAVRRTICIPKWMDDKVSELRLSLSRVTQDALAERLLK
jgi:predicted RNase H-like HicB family nuclease